MCDQAVTGDSPDLCLLLGVRRVPSAGVLRITAAACIRAQVPLHTSVPACRGRGPLLGPPPHWTVGQMPKQNKESILVPAMRMSVLPSGICSLPVVAPSCVVPQMASWPGRDRAWGVFPVGHCSAADPVSVNLQPVILMRTGSGGALWLALVPVAANPALYPRFCAGTLPCTATLLLAPSLNTTHDT